jgi:hypothetical protein
MFSAEIRTAPLQDSFAVSGAAVVAQKKLRFRLEHQVQNALNVWLPLKNPLLMGPLVSYLREVTPTVHKALADLHYVHFARFMPSPDATIMWVITEYDGGLQSYMMDFVGVIGEEFTEILQFIDGAPPLPVQSYAAEFTDWIEKHNLPVEVWSAYPEDTVIDILRSARRG